MVQKILFILILISGLTNAHAYIGFGICNFGNETIDVVICYGPTVLFETTVTGDVKIAGPLKANKVSMGSMTIAGSADVQASKVLGTAEVKGILNANNVSFEKDLIIRAAKAILNHSTVKGSITFNSEGSKPYLKMACGSIVTGSVNFDGKAGVIQITDDSKIQGKVLNGQLEFIKATC